VHYHGIEISEGLHEDRSTPTNRILSASNYGILSATLTSAHEPEPAWILESIPCAMCGESVLEVRIRQLTDYPGSIIDDWKDPLVRLKPFY